MRYPPMFSLALLAVVVSCRAPVGSTVSQTSEPAPFTPVVSPLLAAACVANPTPVESGVGLFSGGGDELAFIQGTDLFVLPSNARSPIHVAENVIAQELSVGATFALFTTPDADAQAVSIDQHAVSVDTHTGARVTLATAHWIYSPVIVNDRALYWTTDDGESNTLWSSPVDGSGAPVAVMVGPSAFGLVAYGSSVAWADDTGWIWTAPADGSAPPTKTNVWVVPNEVFTLDTTTVYFDSSSALYTIPLAGSTPTLFANPLPDDFPASEGPELGSLTAPVVGAHRTFWAQFWANGMGGPNASQLTNWVLRAGTDANHITTIDSFTWTPASATAGTAPSVATDGVAVYWTHEGTLMRLCD